MAMPEGSLIPNNPDLQLAEVDDQQIEQLMQNEVQMGLENIDPRPPRIKLSREVPVFMMPDGSTAKNLTGIIVFFHKTRGYWETEGQKIPTCSSMDGKVGTDENGVKHNCLNCPRNAYGTDKGGRGKACKEMRWIYFLQEGEMLPSKISLPPTSLGEFDTFVSALAQKKMAPIQKIVRLSLKTAEKKNYSYSVLAQPEVIGDTPKQNILGLFRMREAVVAAAKQAGIEAEDYDTEEAGTSATEMANDEPF